MQEGDNIKLLHTKAPFFFSITLIYFPSHFFPQMEKQFHQENKCFCQSETISCFNAFLKKKKKSTLNQCMLCPFSLLRRLKFFNLLAEIKILSSSGMIIFYCCFVQYMFFSIGEKSLGEKNYLTREVVYMVITFNLLTKEKKKCKKNLNVKYHITSKNLPQFPITYHVL